MRPLFGKGCCGGWILLTEGSERITRKVWWNSSTKGVFMVKLAYECTREDTPVTTTMDWKLISKMRGPSRGSMLL